VGIAGVWSPHPVAAQHSPSHADLTPPMKTELMPLMETRRLCRLFRSPRSRPPNFGVDGPTLGLLAPSGSKPSPFPFAITTVRSSSSASRSQVVGCAAGDRPDHARADAAAAHSMLPTPNQRRGCIRSALPAPRPRWVTRSRRSPPRWSRSRAAPALVGSELMKVRSR
jgi:hypothetical protein